MNQSRRQFVKTSLAASAVAALAPESRAETPAVRFDAGREYYELRAYRLKPGASSALLDGYLERALVPALNRRGVANVGVFTELDVNSKATPPSSQPKVDSPVWVFSAYPSVEAFALAAAALNDDPEVRQAGADYLGTPKANPAFDRIDSWLLLAFTGMPKMQVPEFSKAKFPTRFFEFRTYESHSEAKALNKIAMFNAGEIETMKSLGMSPVFYGQALTGSGLPHLSYFTGGPDIVTHFANWKKFGTDPRWLKLRNDPFYADNTSKTGPSRFLTPKSYSQL
jgi:hypothetical protein